MTKTNENENRVLNWGDNKLYDKMIQINKIDVLKQKNKTQ